MDASQFMELGSLASLWGDIPVWLKFLAWLAGLGIAMGGALAAAGSAPVWLTALGAGLGYYAFTDFFFDLDSFFHDWAEYERTGDPHTGVDLIEDGVNLLSPVNPVAEDLTGLQMPGSNSQDGLLDQTIDKVQQRQNKLDDVIRELDI